MNTVHLILGYGTHETSAVRNYYEDIAGSLSKTISKNQRIITNGGYTDRLRNFLSESGMGKKLMQKVCPNLKIYMEDLSFTTSENLRQSEMVLRKWAMRDNWLAEKLVIHCHPIRIWKVRLIAKIFFFFWKIEIEVVGYEGFIYTSQEKWRQWLIKAPAEILITMLSLPEIFVTGRRFKSWLNRT